MTRDTGPSHSQPRLEKAEVDPRSGPASEGHVRQEGPPSGWRSEGLGPSNRRRPCAGEGARALHERAGPATYPSPIPRVAAPITPRHLGETRPKREGRGWRRRGQAGGSQSAGRRQGAGSPRATQTLGPWRIPEQRSFSAFR